MGSAGYPSSCPLRRLSFRSLPLKLVIRNSQLTSQRRTGAVALGAALGAAALSSEASCVFIWASLANLMIGPGHFWVCDGQGAQRNTSVILCPICHLPAEVLCWMPPTQPGLAHGIIPTSHLPRAGLGSRPHGCQRASPTEAAPQIHKCTEQGICLPTKESPHFGEFRSTFVAPLA